MNVILLNTVFGPRKYVRVAETREEPLDSILQACGTCLEFESAGESPRTSNGGASSDVRIVPLVEHFERKTDV